MFWLPVAGSMLRLSIEGMVYVYIRCVDCLRLLKLISLLRTMRMLYHIITCCLGGILGAFGLRSGPGPMPSICSAPIKFHRERNLGLFRPQRVFPVYVPGAFPRHNLRYMDVLCCIYIYIYIYIYVYSHAFFLVINCMYTYIRLWNVYGCCA